MTADQFDALAELMRLRASAAREAARLHLVDGLPIGDAAAQTELSYSNAWNSVQRVTAALALARKAVGAD